MIITRIKFEGKRVRLGGFGFQKYQMFALGRVAEKSVEARVARGLGANDAPMPPLSKKQHPIFIKDKETGTRRFVRMSADRGYGALKLRRLGTDLRNLNYSGKLMQSFRVVYADERKVVLDVSTKLERIKARVNERLAPWYGFSRNDERNVFAAARTMFKGNIANFGVRLRGGVGLTRNPIWMNPAGLSARAAA